mgnify:CR=1 FL=1
MQLTRSIFWDTRYETIDWDKNAAYVIDRVLHFGTLTDWKKILTYYGRERIKEVVLHLRYMDKRALSFCSIYFQVPKEQCRCFNTGPSIRQQRAY